MNGTTTTWQVLCPSRYWRHPALDAISACLDDPEVQAHIDSLERRDVYPDPILEMLKRTSLHALFDPLADGAAGQPHFTLLNALTARQSGALAITLGVHGLGLLPIHVAGSPAQLAYVSNRIREGAFAALLLTELDAGSDLARNRALAEPGFLDESGRFVGGKASASHYRLTGEKQLINGGTRHELLVALFRAAKPSGEARGSFGLPSHFALFLLERGEGITSTAPWRTLPCPSADIAGVRFEGSLAPASALLGAVGDGFGIIQRTLAISRGAVSGLAVGAVTRARELATQHARTRELYGAPIVMLDPIAEHICRIEALDVLVASISVKQALAVNAFGPGAAHLTAVAKYAASRLAEEAIDEGRKVLSARALLKDGPYERLIRDVLLYGVFDGTAHVMLEQIQFRLEQWTASAPEAMDALAFAAECYGTEPRSLMESARQRGRPPIIHLDLHAQAFATHATTYPLAHIGELGGFLVQMARALRNDATWERDGALRFAFAHVFAMLETLCATAELCDSGCRAALGISALECDPNESARLEWAGRFAVGWLGARLVAELRALSLRTGIRPHSHDFSDLERAFLEQRDHAETTMRTRLREGLLHE